MEMALGSAVGALVTGSAGLEAGRYNRDVANAQAADEIATGNAEQLRIREAARAQMGLQVAGQAESGFAPGTGSALRMLEESAINAELDILTIRRAAEGRAAALRAQGRMARNEGRMAFTAGASRAGGELAKAIASGGGNYGG